MKKENINNTADRKETCGDCHKEKIIKFECGFCSEGRMCKECGEGHRNWCGTRDEWKFI